LTAKGDLDVDFHHTVEDCGIVLGTALSQALGDKVGIKRFGNASIPMDETLATCALDLSGRPYLHFDCTFDMRKIGNFDTELIKEFFRAFAVNANITLHIACPYGDNSHHQAEAMFKALAVSLKDAVTVVSNEIPSTKGVV
jgi:imidazoleglycerol-phosphate dehydratase